MTTDVNVRGYDTFQTLYDQAFAALAKIDKARTAADAKGDTATSRALLDQWSRISDWVLEVNDAEVAYLTSAAPASSTAVGRLRKVVGNAQSTLKDLEELSKALAAASEMLSLLTRMIRLVT